MITATKILSLSEIPSVLDEERVQKSVVQCHGVFDLLHIGHIRHLKKAKELGDIVVVTVTPDRYVNKGPGRPYFDERLRAEAIAALDSADYVVVNEYPTAVEAIDVIKPDIYVKGSEYKLSKNDITGKILEEESAVKAHGGRICFTEDITYSSSTLINRFFPGFPEHVNEYLQDFRKRYKPDDILSHLDGLKDMRVMVIGEAIIDEYNFCDAIGKSGKEPVLVTKHIKKESYAGGVLAVANHVANFCKEVICLTAIGENSAYQAFIENKIKDNVKLEFLCKADSPTLVKRRYVDHYSKQKLFEIYEMNDDSFNQSQNLSFMQKIRELAPGVDAVIVADYGHGLIDDEAVRVISENAKFLSVNTQANAGNHGFNCISKYPKADYICIAHREIELTFRQKGASLTQHISQLRNQYNYTNIMITDGRSGCMIYRPDDGIVKVPAFAYKISDRVGAGDSVLAITSLCVARNTPAEIVGFIGNAVGAEAVSIMGNQRYIEKIPLMKHISHLMK